MASRLQDLRTIITENLRVQRGGAKPVDYVDVSNALSGVRARQNHVIFGRRGCGKTLLLTFSAKNLPQETKVVLA
jgi:predicted AAA+ superfamily ATPase